jgi:hypothetical protein
MRAAQWSCRDWGALVSFPDGAAAGRGVTAPSDDHRPEGPNGFGQLWRGSRPLHRPPRDGAVAEAAAMCSPLSSCTLSMPTLALSARGETLDRPSLTIVETVLPYLVQQGRTRNSQQERGLPLVARGMAENLGDVPALGCVQ